MQETASRLTPSMERDADEKDLRLRNVLKNPVKIDN